MPLTLTDMNDAANLFIYSELVRFQVDTSRHDVHFRQPCSLKQKALHLFAHGLGLQYEYFVTSREARISRVVPSPVLEAVTPELEGEQSVFDRRRSDITLDSSVDTQVGLQPILASTPEDIFAYELNSDCFAFGVAEAPESVFDLNWDTNDDELRVEEHDFLCTGHPTVLNPYSEFSSSQEPQHFPNPFRVPIHQSEVEGSLDPIQFDMEEGVLIPSHHCHGVSYEHPSSCMDYNEQSSTSTFATTQFSSITGKKDTCTSLTDTLPLKSRRPGSRAGSISSAKSSGGRHRVSKMVRRKSSIHQADNSAVFQEFVFDSRPASRSPTSGGRHRPLGASARAAIKAVAAAGACWRCKFLRKQCDTGSLCDACPKTSSQSPWRSLGCKRGTIKTAMLPIQLCRQNAFENTTSPGVSDNQKCEIICMRANGYLYQAIKRRPEHTPTDTDPTSQFEVDIDPFLQCLTNRWPSLKAFQSDRISSINHPVQLMLIPLDECILAILWETFDCPLSQHIVGSAGTALILMRAAALLQAKTTTDQLIALSLVCLRTCLEALRLKYSGFLDIVSHRSCDPSACKIDCIAQLSSALTKYLAELSRVFFKKENMRCKSFRLTIFYSLCIQSIVRKALICLVGSGGSIDLSLGVKNYLHLAVRLFIASSSSYDPLMDDFSAQPDKLVAEDVTRIEDYRLAQFASEQEKWHDAGITNTVGYLKHIFEDREDINIELHPGEEITDDLYDDDIESQGNIS